MVFDGIRRPDRADTPSSAHGTSPLDDFTCYPPFSTGQCRYGDYSMAQNYNGQDLHGLRVRGAAATGCPEQLGHPHLVRTLP